MSSRIEAAVLWLLKCKISAAHRFALFDDERYAEASTMLRPFDCGADIYQLGDFLPISPPQQ